MRVGIVSSSDGQTFAQLARGVEHLDVSFTVVTDRRCGIEDVARARQIPCVRIAGEREEFSRRAAQELTSASVAYVLLYFNRLVSADLYEAVPTYNIHPSLLPAFPGFGALQSARERDVRFVGATLHLATQQPDAGPIVAQVCAPVWPRCPEERLAELSFVQRVYLSLLSVELACEQALVVDARAGRVRYAARRPYTDRCNPALQDPAMQALVRELEEARALELTAWA
ncbi:MAG: phosphoribosylglycinamide formyltransferase 1 [Solirubrobacteraceae bacterium]|nr:phosphoribosylglycinamide formyltransferase 1 [Solirubrobacteraceae bacterium]